MICPNYDLCEKCKMSGHHSEHIMLPLNVGTSSSHDDVSSSYLTSTKQLKVVSVFMIVLHLIQNSYFSSTMNHQSLQVLE